MESQHRHELRQGLDVVRDNPFGLPHDAAREVVAALNRDLASMLTLYQQYHKHHWIVEGAQFLELHLLLEEHYTQLHTQYDQIAERIVALGGLPVSGPVEIQEHAYIEHEATGMFDLREMLEHDLDAEGKLAENLRDHIALAKKVGDYGTESLLKTILEATEKRAAFLEKHLMRESLTRHIPVE
jgi:starvation-inducible DNA-binding protein